MASWSADDMLPLTGRICKDVTDHLMDMILREENRRLERYQSLEQFWTILGENQPTSGPQFVRARLCKIISAVCHCDPYDEGAYNAAMEEAKGKKATNMTSSLLDPAFPLAGWKVRHWNDFKDLLLLVKNEMLLKRNMAGNEDEDYDDDEIDEERAMLPMYTEKVEAILELIEMQRALAKFRWDLEQQVEANVQFNRPVKIDGDKISDLAQAIEEMDEGRVKESLNYLLVREETKRKTRLSGLTLQSPKVLKESLQSKALNLYHFQEKVKRLMARWLSNTLGEEWVNKNSVLTQQGYRADDQDQYIFSLAAAASAASASPTAAAYDDNEDAVAGGQKENQSPVAQGRLKRVLEEQDVDDNGARKPAAKRAKTSPAPPADPTVANLREKRAHLRQEGTDPLAEAEAIASTAAAAPPAAARRDRDLDVRKKSAQALAFDSSDEEEEEDKGVKLSAVPERARVRSPRGRDEDVVWEKNKSGTRKRHPWTAEETQALCDAIKEHGRKWSRIKCDPKYNIALARRSGPDLKDKVRNMEKDGEKL